MSYFEYSLIYNLQHENIKCIYEGSISNHIHILIRQIIKFTNISKQITNVL